MTFAAGATPEAGVEENGDDAQPDRPPATAKSTSNLDICQPLRRNVAGHPNRSRLSGKEPYSASGGGRNTTSCLADRATTSGGFCSFMPWIAQNRSYSLRVGVTQNRHLIGCSDLLNNP